MPTALFRPNKHNPQATRTGMYDRKLFHMSHVIHLLVDSVIISIIFKRRCTYYKTFQKESKEFKENSSDEKETIKVQGRANMYRKYRQ